MIKYFVAIAALCSMVFAYQGAGVKHDPVTIDVVADGNSAKAVDLHFHVTNSDAISHTIRLSYNLPDAEKYAIDRNYSTTCTENEDARNLPGAIYNFKKSKNKAGDGVYALDLQFNQPAGYQNFCLTIKRSDYTEFLPFTQEVDFTIDQKGSPLDNPVIYNYIPKVRDLNYYGQFKGALDAGETFFAWTYRQNGDSVKTKGLDISGSADTAHVLATMLVDLNVDSYGMYKDTRMLAAAFGELVDDYRWNQSTFDGNMYADVESRTINMGRCWAIAVFNIYSYFYGNRNTKLDAVTQDEMVYLAKTRNEDHDRQVGVFVPSQYSEAGYPSDVAFLLDTLFGDVHATIHEYTNEPISAEKLLNILRDEETPLPIDISVPPGSGHCLLVDGMAIDSDGKYLVHLVNLDNFAREGYFYFDDLALVLKDFITYDVPSKSKVLKTDLLHPVDVDSDNDGVVDYDEFYRFLSDEYKSDSDGDLVSDYDEIYSYISTIPLDLTDDGSGFIVGDTSFAFGYGKKDKKNDPQNNADIKGFVKELGPAVDIPENVALYALDWISYNDNVVCFNKQEQGGVIEGLDKDYANCNIVSEGTSVDNYVVNVGSRSYLGNVFSKGKVWIRDGARVNAAYMYNTNAKVDVQGSSTKNPYKLYSKSSNWRYNVNKELPEIDVGTETKIVSNGQSYNLKDGDKFAFLKVESGGTLYIEPGIVYVGNIQIESGSVYAFTNPGYSTILHLNGSVIWRGKLDSVYTQNVINARETGMYHSGYRYQISRGFKTYQHSNNEMYIDSPWLGTIIAPKSRLVLAQPSYGKKLVGQFLASELTVHQNTEIFQVNYNPIVTQALAKKAAAQENTIENNDVANESLSGKSISIVSVNPETLSFETAAAGNYQIFIGKVDGSKVASFNFNNAQIGVNTANIASAKLIRGRYIVAVKRNGSVASKMVLIK